MNWKPIKSYDYLVIHCAATKASMDIGVAEIAKWHREKGWFDVGYHYVIRRDGTVEKGRPDDRPGAHARSYNHISLGICLVGGVSEDGKTPEDNFTFGQWNSLTELVTNLKETYPDAVVLGHRDLPNVHKACPSFDVQSWWATVEENRDHGKPRNESAAAPTDSRKPKRSGGCILIPRSRSTKKD